MAGGKGKGGCIESCLQCVLVLFNVILLIAGIALIVVGALCYWKPSLILDAVDIYDFTVKLSRSNADKVNSENIEGYLVPFGLAIFILGIVVSVVTFIGYCGARCKIKCFLYTYAFFVAIIALLIAAIIIAFFGFRSQLADVIRDQWNETMVHHYRGDDDQGSVDSIVSLLVTAINRKFECCGVDDYRDFNGAINWNRTAHYKNAQGVTLEATGLMTPLSCCKHQGSFPSDQPVSPPECAVTPNNDTSNYLTGCWKVTVDTFDKPTRICVFALVAFFCVLVLLLGFAIYLARDDEFMGKA